MSSNERRLRRSADPLIALHYQLTQLKKEGSLDAIVLTDQTGTVVAGAGSWPLCEELAAYAPIWSNEAPISESRVGDMRKEVDLRSVNIGGSEMIVCTRKGGNQGTRSSQEIMNLAEESVLRILAA